METPASWAIFSMVTHSKPSDSKRFFKQDWSWLISLFEVSFKSQRKNIQKRDSKLLYKKLLS